ncbi:MAG: RidA family protein [Bacteroidetes bacterium]|nr:RidA family protein [Bacteroidota bacterium]
MSKNIIQTSEAPEPLGPYSQAVSSGKMLFVSGQIPLDPQTGELVTGNIEEETKMVMRNIQAILQAGGTDFSRVVKCSIFVKDLNDFSRINRVYGDYFPQQPPARETVEVNRLPKDVNVEISCIAIV